MKRIYNYLIISTLSILLIACGSKENASRPQTGYLTVFGDDSCHCISYDDTPIFSTDNTNASLFYNDIAAVQDRDGKWGYINRKGERKLSTTYQQATVYSEGLAWVIKQGDMPGAINEKGDIKISLRDKYAVRVFMEGRAAIAIVKKKQVLWGFINKNGNEIIKPEYKTVSDYRLGLAAVQNIEGKWGYINLNGECVIPCQYEKAFSFNDNGLAIVKNDNRYHLINREGSIVQTHAYDEMIPDGLWARVRIENQWGWCNEKGQTVVSPQFTDSRAYGNADLAPVKIRGKWGYIDRSGKVVIKRQFTEAYPFIDNCAAVKTGTVWGFIDTKGCFTVNPQYDYISQDYLYQALGLGCSMSTLQIK
ncbi:MAG: WG repeat-containing protein [Bacteroidaceae bacterium]|nr:WG repeat-containing protein [Bacteroidaceae bacterium]